MRVHRQLSHRDLATSRPAGTAPRRAPELGRSAADEVGGDKGLTWALGNSERVDLVDADEPIWAFGEPSCVESVGKVLVSGLVVLTKESCYQLYCGLGCGRLPVPGSQHTEFRSLRAPGTLRSGCAMASGWWCWSFPA